MNTCAIGQNKLLRTGHSSGRTTYLAELTRDLVSTQGFSVPGYNILTLLNHDASEIGILPSVTGANITYIGVFGGIANPSSGVPKLGQLSEWAMSKAHQGEGNLEQPPEPYQALGAFDCRLPKGTPFHFDKHPVLLL